MGTWNLEKRQTIDGVVSVDSSFKIKTGVRGAWLAGIEEASGALVSSF